MKHLFCIIYFFISISCFSQQTYIYSNETQYFDQDGIITLYVENEIRITLDSIYINDYFHGFYIVDHFTADKTVLLVDLNLDFKNSDLWILFYDKKNNILKVEVHSTMGANIRYLVKNKEKIYKL